MLESVRKSSILYGSETGTARDAAYRLAVNLKSVNVQIEHFCDMNSFPPDQLRAKQVVLFICSTAGDGECPSNMAQFWQILRQRSLPSDLLSQLQFSIFGLGDSSFDKFNATARRLQVRLRQLGAVEIEGVESGFGDDQGEFGYVGEFERWKDEIMKKLMNTSSSSSSDQISYSPHLGHYSVQFREEVGGNGVKEGENTISENPPSSLLSSPLILSSNLFQLTTSKLLTAQDWTIQKVSHLEFSLLNNQTPNSQLEEGDEKGNEDEMMMKEEEEKEEGSILSYLPGDVAILFPHNRQKDVQLIKQLLVDEPNISTTTAINSTDDVYQSTYIDIQVDEEYCASVSWPFLPFEAFNPPFSCSLGDLFLKYLDLGGIPHLSFFLTLSELAEDEEDGEKLREIGSKDGVDLYFNYCVREKRGYAEVLSEFRSIPLSIPLLIHLIPPIQPRQFSIASCPYSHPGFDRLLNHSFFCFFISGQIHLCVGAVNRITPRRRTHEGVCSSFLCNLPLNSILQIWIKKGTLSQSLRNEREFIERDMVLVGPGTGISPMRSLVHFKKYFMERMVEEEKKEEERKRGNSPISSIGKILFFMGFRSQLSDYLYGEEWERIAENNRSELMQDGRENSWFSHIPVFSRDQESKVYVTHSIKNNHKLVENMLCHSDDIIDHEVGEKEEMGVGSERKRALLFVAGNASNTMVKDVKAEIDKIGYSSSPSSSSSQTNSVGLVSHLKKEKRMFIEAW